MSLLEIYNESIRDLVEPREEGAAEEKKLEVKIAPEGGTCVPGIAVTQVRPAALSGISSERRQPSACLAASSLCGVGALEGGVAAVAGVGGVRGRVRVRGSQDEVPMGALWRRFYAARRG